MRKLNEPTILTAGSIAMVLQLGTATALAQAVCVDERTVIAIKGLEVITDQYGVIDIDVDFRYATG